MYKRVCDLLRIQILTAGKALLRIGRRGSNGPRGSLPQGGAKVLICMYLHPNMAVKRVGKNFRIGIQTSNALKHKKKKKKKRGGRKKKNKERKRKEISEL